MSDAKPPPAKLLFRPDAFFIKPWRGWGVLRDGRGRPVQKFQAQGAGRTGTRSAFTEQTISFIDGPSHVVRWEIQTDDEERFFARDLDTDVEAEGGPVGEDFRWVFATRIPTRFFTFNARTVVTYTLVTPTTAFAFAETRLFGRVASTITTYFEQL